MINWLCFTHSIGVIPGISPQHGAVVHYEQPLYYDNTCIAWFWLSAICHKCVPEPKGPRWFSGDTERRVRPFLLLCLFWIVKAEYYSNIWIISFMHTCIMLQLQSQSRVALQSWKRTFISTRSACFASSVLGYCLSSYIIASSGDRRRCQTGEDPQ